VEQNWKKAKIHKNIANVASGLGKIVEKKSAEKNILGGAWGLVPQKKSQSEITQRNRVISDTWPRTLDLVHVWEFFQNIFLKVSPWSVVLVGIWKKLKKLSISTSNRFAVETYFYIFSISPLVPFRWVTSD